MSRTGWQRWIACSLALLTWLVIEPARADGPYEGQWREGPMNIRVDVESWGGDCGPRPRSTTAPGGGTFRISQSGDQLTFHLRRQRTTRSCWSENRAVRRVSSTYQAGTWRIVCRTPPEDSRAETGTYTIQAIGDDRLQFRDQSRYDWELNESRCRARITTTQTFTRVGGGPETPETPEPPERRCTPGDPARVVLRPATAEIQPGGEQCFTARVVDARGCPVRRASLAVAEGDPGAIEGRCYRAGEGSGEARVVARAGRLSAEARVSVHPMDLSDLIARRTETGSVGSGTHDEDASSETAARVSTREADEGPGLLWPALALLAALLLVGVAVVLLRRRGRDGGAATRRPAKKKAGIGGLPGVEVPEPEVPEPEVPEREVPEREVPEREVPEPEVPEREVPDDERPTRGSPATGPGADGAASSDRTSRGAGAPGDEPSGAASPAGDDRICPTCRRGYPPGTDRCPHDDTALMDYRDFAAGKGPGGVERRNVCPVCGERYPVTVTFCGKDGATLEPSET